MTSQRTTRLKLLFICSLALLPACLLADNSAALRQRLHEAELQSSLDQPDLKPWHLLLSFQLLDAKGQPWETGTIEEWWAGPHLHKTVFSSPSFTNTELINDLGFYKTFPDLYPPELLALIQEQIVHPAAEASEVEDSTPDLRKQDFGKVQLDCIMLDQVIKNVAYPSLGLFPTYCFDRDKTSLRITSKYGMLIIARNRMGLFQGKSVALDQSITLNGIAAITSHLEKLTGMPLTAADFIPGKEMIRIDEKSVSVPSGVMAGAVTQKVNPTYPERAKANHVSGTVTLEALIGRDGHIHMLKLVSTPDSDLAIASFLAVRQWTYKPYLLNGLPVDVLTTIHVNFKFGPA